MTMKIQYDPIEQVYDLQLTHEELKIVTGPLLDQRHPVGILMLSLASDAVMDTGPRAIRSRNTPKWKEHRMQLVVEVLEKNKGNRKRTAKEMGLSERTLYRIINQINEQAQATS